MLAVTSLDRLTASSVIAGRPFAAVAIQNWLRFSGHWIASWLRPSH